VQFPSQSQQGCATLAGRPQARRGLWEGTQPQPSGQVARGVGAGLLPFFKCPAWNHCWGSLLLSSEACGMCFMAFSCKTSAGGWKEEGQLCWVLSVAQQWGAAWSSASPRHALRTQERNT